MFYVLRLVLKYGNAFSLGAERYPGFLRAWREATSLPAAADGPVALSPPAPEPWVLIPTIRAWQHLHGSTAATSRLAPSLRAFMNIIYA
jgi:hypothetical protein